MDKQEQATVNVLAAQRNAALDSCANMAGRIAVLEQECRDLAAEIQSLKDKHEPSTAG